MHKYLLAGFLVSVYGVLIRILANPNRFLILLLFTLILSFFNQYFSVGFLFLILSFVIIDWGMNIYYYGKMFFRVKQKFPNGLEVMFDETGMKFVSLEKVDSPKLFWTHFKFIIRSELMGIYAFCHKENESFTIVFKKELGDRFL